MRAASPGLASRLTPAAALIAGLALGCAEVAAPVDAALDPRTRAILIVTEEPLSVTAIDRAGLDAEPLLIGARVAILEYEETLAELGLPAAAIPAGDCRPLPEPMRARSRDAVDGAWASPAALSERARALRIGCDGCPGREADARGRCLPACRGRRLQDGTCLETCFDGEPVDDDGVCSNGCAPGLVTLAGACVEPERCDGVRDDATGACHAPGDCASFPGFHDGGDGRCVRLGQCSPGFADGGGGTCTTPGACAAGYHASGDGRCLILAVCAEGFDDGGDGRCVPDGACSSGFARAGALGCVPIERCPLGAHDGGTGACVPEGTCAPGFTIDAAGACFRWRALAPLSVPRFQHAAGSAGGLDLVVAGGNNDSSGALASVEVYDGETDRWRFGPDLPEPRAKMSSLELPGGRLFLQGGVASPRWQMVASTIRVLDRDGRSAPLFGTPLDALRFGGTVGLLGDGRVLLIGGAPVATRLDVISRITEVLDPVTERWSRADDTPVDTFIASTALLGVDRMLVAMGPTQGAHTPTRHTKVFEGGRWRVTAELRTPRVSAPLVPLATGEVLMPGGNLGFVPGLNLDTATSAVELYVPGEDRWRSAPEMLAPRWAHAAIRLCDGRVLAAGGADRVGPIDTAELFDPRTETWSSAGRFAGRRLSPVLVRRADCSVVVIGGAERFEEVAPDGQVVPRGARVEVWSFESPGVRVRR